MRDLYKYYNLCMVSVGYKISWNILWKETGPEPWLRGWVEGRGGGGGVLGPRVNINQFQDQLHWSRELVLKGTSVKGKTWR